MGSAVPYAIAAKFAYPDRPVIALRGRRRDADERHRALIDDRPALAPWSDPRLIVLVLNNRDLN